MAVQNPVFSLQFNHSIQDKILPNIALMKTEVQAFKTFKWFRRIRSRLKTIAGSSTKFSQLKVTSIPSNYKVPDQF